MLHPTRLVYTLVIGLCCLPRTGAMQVDRWQQLLFTAAQARDRGYYAEAERLLEEARGLARQSEHHDSAVTSALNNLGLLYQLEGKYAEAEDLLLKSLEMPADDRERASILHNLGAVYRREGRWKEAEQAIRHALALWGKS